MGKLVDVVLDTYDGSLKAEHGTGVNMAPFVEREWGEQATALMWRIKELADPDCVLGPGVVLNRDPDCHLANLKTTPEIEEVATSASSAGSASRSARAAADDDAAPADRPAPRDGAPAAGLAAARDADRGVRVRRDGDLRGRRSARTPARSASTPAS